MSIGENRRLIGGLSREGKNTDRAPIIGEPEQA
jgi:hypothetical protein